MLLFLFNCFQFLAHKSKFINIAKRKKREKQIELRKNKFDKEKRKNRNGK